MEHYHYYALFQQQRDSLYYLFHKFKYPSTIFFFLIKRGNKWHCPMPIFFASKLSSTIAPKKISAHVHKGRASAHIEKLVKNYTGFPMKLTSSTNPNCCNYPGCNKHTRWFCIEYKCFIVWVGSSVSMDQLLPISSLGVNDWGDVCRKSRTVIFQNNTLVEQVTSEDCGKGKDRIVKN